MKTTFFNKTTNETKSIFDLFINADENIQSDGARGERFLNKYADILCEIAKAEDGSSIFAVNNDWEVVSGSRKRGTNAANKPKPTNKPTAKPKPSNDVTPTNDERPNDERPNDEHGNDVTTTTTNENNVQAIESELATKYGEIGADVCRLVDARISANKPTTTATNTTITINDETHEVSGKTNANFHKIVLTVKKGYPVYMYGEAGTGKSHQAKQVAEALGLEFYESQQVMYAHEMKGYGDGGGNFVETPFFKAFTRGGLFHLDEVDASQPEALVVLNTAIANRRFDFPVIGNVEAHPDFRVIASGNTKMSGADIEYAARNVQDASTKNRFFFVHVDYDTEIENDLAGEQRDVADFCRDLRNAKKETQISLCVSYRQIKTLCDKDLQEAWGLPDLLTGGVFKDLEADEIRIIYGALTDTTNRWAKAMKKLF